MRIKLATPLIGEFPRYADVKLPGNGCWEFMIKHLGAK